MAVAGLRTRGLWVRILHRAPKKPRWLHYFRRQRHFHSSLPSETCRQALSNTRDQGFSYGRQPAPGDLQNVVVDIERFHRRASAVTSCTCGPDANLSISYVYLSSWNGAGRSEVRVTGAR